MELFKNKFFLYFIVFIALANVLGMLHQKEFDLIVLFVVFSIFSLNFTENMIQVLLIALILTNLFRAIYGNETEITKFL